MRLAQYVAATGLGQGSAVSLEPGSQSGEALRSRLAWVEPNGELVDAVMAYQLDLSARGVTQDASFLQRLQSLDALVQDWQYADRFLVLEELRERWLELLKQGHEEALACRVNQNRDKDANGAGAKLVIPFSPVSFRDFYAFEQHVKTARARRGLEMVPEWYEMPVFYFSNSRSFRGPGQAVAAPESSLELDFELEVACVLGQPGQSILAEQADQFIAGFVLLNDWSARDLQRAEMKVGLGPAKGKDFATSFGPYFVTPNELPIWNERRANAVPHSMGPSHSHSGNQYDVSLNASVNGQLLSQGNLKDLYYTFAQMVERASRDVPMVPGEVLGSGTVGTGCILELGTQVHRWLLPGDLVRLEAGPLGTLETPIVERKPRR